MINDLKNLLAARRQIESVKNDLAKINFYYRSAKYSPNQPRIPAGNPDGGQWGSSGSVSKKLKPTTSDDATTPVAARRLTRDKEKICNEQLDRDLFHCHMVGNGACVAQAMFRYSNCLTGRPIPPLNY